MKKKKFSILVSLVVVAILTLPMSVAFATKPTEISIQSFVVIPTGPPILSPLGNSGNIMVTWTDLPCGFVAGDIIGWGVYNGHTLLGKDGEVVASHGVINLYDAEVYGKTGDLKIVMGVTHWRIIDATGELVNLHGGGSSADSGTLGLYIIQGWIHFN